MKTPNKTSRSPWLLIGTTLLAVGSLPFLTGADRGSAQYEQDRKQIAAMSATQRAQFEQNFTEFSGMSPAQRLKLVAFHRELENDPALRQTLASYQKWLQTLSPWERDELRKETDLAKRMSLVRKFKGSSALEGLNADDLAAVMQVIEKSATYNTDERKKLSTSEPPARYLVILSKALPSRSRRPGARWPASSRMPKIIDAISDDKLRERLDGIDDDDDKRRALGLAILAGLERQFSILREQNKPSQQELDKFFVQLEGSERDRLMQMSPRDMKRRLELRFLFKQKPDSEPRPKQFDVSWQYWVVTSRLRSSAGLRSQYGGGRPPFGQRGGGPKRPPFRGGGDRPRSRS